MFGIIYHISKSEKGLFVEPPLRVQPLYREMFIVEQAELAVTVALAVQGAYHTISQTV